MSILFEFEDNLNISINSISVVGSFNGFNMLEGRMNKLGTKWKMEIEIQPGEYYYKFIINGNIKINDPIANYYVYEDDEVWSGLIINSQNKRLYNNTEYTVHIENYNIQNYLEENLSLVNKKDFNLLIDKKVVVRFEFTQITGLHSATVLWCTPTGEIYDSAESVIVSVDGKPNINWFLLELNKIEATYVEGAWTMKLLIDGIAVLEDRFNLKKMNTYGPQGMIC